MTKIIHFHFETSTNIGDAAVVYSIRDSLSTVIKNYEYTSMSIFDLSEINVSNYFIHEIINKNILFRHFIKSTFLLNTLIYAIKIIRYFKGKSMSQLIKAINSHDLMIIGGGGVYSKWVLPFNIDMINKVTIPIVIFGAGYNSDLTTSALAKVNADSIIALNKIAKISSVRDQNTFNLLKEYNCKSLLIGDPAIFLEANKTRISFSGLSIKIGLNISNHETHTQNQADKIIDIYYKLILELKKQYSVQVFYLKHSMDEELVVKKIKKLLPDIIICNYGAREMKYIYEKLDLVISMMLHSSIFAYGSNTKFINIAYDQKNLAFMKLINNTEYLIDMRDLEYKTLFSNCIKLIEDKNYFAKVVDKKYFETKIKRFISEINSLIN